MVGEESLEGLKPGHFFLKITHLSFQCYLLLVYTAINCVQIFFSIFSYCCLKRLDIVYMFMNYNK